VRDNYIHIICLTCELGNSIIFIALLENYKYVSKYILCTYLVYIPTNKLSSAIGSASSITHNRGDH